MTTKDGLKHIQKTQEEAIKKGKPHGWEIFNRSYNQDGKLVKIEYSLKYQKFLNKIDQEAK